MADTKSMKEYGFLEPGWGKKKKKESRIFPDFKSRWKKKITTKGKAESELVWGKRLFQKMLPVALPCECGEDLSMFICRDNRAKRKSKDRKWRREN